jgi:ribonuclease III
MLSDTSPKRTPEELQQFIGYSFHDIQILKDALTRHAFRNENKSDTEGYMDSLATLGDAVLGAVVVCRFYENAKQKKGDLTKRKISGIRREKTRTFAERNKLGEYIRWGKGETTPTLGDKTLDTVTEALIGAVFLDAQNNNENGITAVNEMLDRLKYFQ